GLAEVRARWQGSVLSRVNTTNMGLVLPGDGLCYLPKLPGLTSLPFATGHLLAANTFALAALAGATGGCGQVAEGQTRTDPRDQPPWKVYGEAVAVPRCGPAVTGHVLATLDKIKADFGRPGPKAQAE